MLLAPAEVGAIEMVAAGELNTQDGDVVVFLDYGRCTYSCRKSTCRNVC